MSEIMDEIQQKMSEYIITSTLQIRLLNTSDFGTYTCRTRNMFCYRYAVPNASSVLLRQQWQQHLRQGLHNNSLRGVTDKDMAGMCEAVEDLWKEGYWCAPNPHSSPNNLMFSVSFSALEDLHELIEIESFIDQNPELRAVLDEEDRLGRAVLYNRSSPAARYNWPLKCWSMSNTVDFINN
jgi:hypothetical protein